MRAEDCAVIVLASGLSKRFGTPDKLMADLQGKPILAHIVHTLSGINFSKHYAVIPQGAEELEALLGGAGFTIIRNPDPKSGQGISLSIGAKTAIKDGHKSACVCLADMPFVPSGHIKKLLATNDEVVMSSYQGMHMPPAIFRRAALDNLMHIRGDKGGKFALKHSVTKHIPLSKCAARDIDTLSDLNALNAL